MKRNLLLLGFVGSVILGGCGAPGWSVTDRPAGSGGDSASAAGAGAGGAPVGSEPGTSGANGASAGVTSSAGGAFSDPTTSASGASSIAGRGFSSGGASGAGAASGAVRNGAGGGAGGTRGGGAGGISAGVGGKSGNVVAGAGGANANAGGAGSSGTNTDYLKTRTRNYGFVDITASSKNQILSLTTTLTVPVKPSAKTGTLFLWPGLQPGGANFEPIDNGVLQPVLTWGGTCAPNAPKNGYLSWWISAQYVNTFGKDPGYTGCLGGPGMNVQVGDPLQIVMTLNGTIWHQTITDPVTDESVSFDIDMQGQAQNHAEFDIEIYSEPPVSDVVFTATTVTFAAAEAASCQPTTRGLNDFFSNPKASADGKQCFVDRIALRAQGVPATTPN